MQGFCSLYLIHISFWYTNRHQYVSQYPTPVLFSFTSFFLLVNLKKLSWVFLFFYQETSRLQCVIPMGNFFLIGGHLCMSNCSYNILWDKIYMNILLPSFLPKLLSRSFQTRLIWPRHNLEHIYAHIEYVKVKCQARRARAREQCAGNRAKLPRSLQTNTFQAYDQTAPTRTGQLHIGLPNDRNWNQLSVESVECHTSVCYFAAIWRNVNTLFSSVILL